MKEIWKEVPFDARYKVSNKGNIKSLVYGNETISRDEFAQGVLRGAAINLITWIDYHAAEGNMCLSNMECKDIEDALVSGDWNKIYVYMKKKLEKQGDDIEKIKELENKIESLQKCFKIANDEIADKSQELYALKCKIEDEGYQWDEENLELRKIKQKPINKVEPKFKIGDWVVNKLGDVWYIDSFDEKNYQVSNGNEYNYFPISKQNEMHLWTVKDAKEGDVLANDKHILIFKELGYTVLSNGKPVNLYAYCGIKPDRSFELGKEHYCFCGILRIHPATKEQRELLFKKMKEAGYEWDAEKKELKKISQEYPLIPDECIKSTWKPSEKHYELEEFAKIVRGNLTGISKAVQKLFEAKYLQLTGNKMYGGFKD